MTIASPPVLCAGTYRDGGGTGLRAIRQDGQGTWIVGDAYAGAPNASFSVYSARHDLHYIVDEQTNGAIGVHRHGRDGWQCLAVASTGGAAPCHVALDSSETLLAAANYASGSVSLFRLDERNGLPGPAQVRANRGSGPNVTRQEAPHAHWVGFDPHGRWLYQTDLGTDEILAFAIGAGGILGEAQRAYAAPPGSGPRHLLLHPHLPDRAYLVSELASTLTVLDRTGGTFAHPRILSTLPDGWRADTIVAHVALNRAGDRLYVSNRGHDGIAVFALDDGGIPTPVQHAAVGGAFPRFFLLLEEQGVMVVANEKAQTVTMLPIAADGRLSPATSTLPIPGVAYILKA